MLLNPDRVGQYVPEMPSKQTNTCTVRCKTATTPVNRCECSCGGANHGTQQSVTEWGVKTVDSSDPFETIHITGSGVEVEKKVETLADTGEFGLEDLEPGDVITVFHENAAEGWQKHHRLEVEAVRDSGVLVQKQDGFYDVVSPDQIPTQQLRV